MLTHLFYFMGLFFIWKELAWIYSPKEKCDDAKRFFELSKINKGRKWDAMTPEYKSEIKSKIPSMIIYFWLFVGLFTFQWDAFLFILLFNLIIIAPISKLTRFSGAYVALHWLNSVIGFAFGVFVIINHYHLHISLFEECKRWLS